MSEDAAKKGMELRAKLWGEKAARDGDAFLRSFDEGLATFLNEQLFGTGIGPGCRSSCDR